MKKYLLGIVTTFACAAGPVFAADLGVAYKAPYVAPPSWAGFYIGGSLGYSWNKLTVNDLDYWDGFGDNSQSNSGFIGGGQVGYNWQNRGLVYGIEADISGLTNRSTSNNDFCCTPNPYAQINSRIDALGTVRGRVGIAVDPALLYLTGGLAFGDVSNSYNDLQRTPNEFWNDNGWRTGWTFGAGLEAKWSENWSWKVEALDYQLSENTITVARAGNGNPNPFRQRFDDQGVIARVGINYLFR
jgi:outer membrane immunogenic protein